MSGLRHLALLVRLLIEDRQRLALENIALRHQLAVLKRSVKRAKIHDSDRMFWILMKKMLADWRDAVHFVKPDTVVRWHRKGFRYYWKRKRLASAGFLDTTGLGTGENYHFPAAVRGGRGSTS